MSRRPVTLAVSVTPEQLALLDQAAKFRNLDPAKLAAIVLRDFLAARPTPARTPAYRMTAETKAELRRLHARGLNDPEIGAHIGVTAETVRRFRHRCDPKLPANDTRGRGPKTTTSTTTGRNEHA
jgi:DNA-binding NarL/FixJ family response regulator